MDENGKGGDAILTSSDCEVVTDNIIGIYLADEDAIMPTRSYNHDVGYDLYSLEDVEIEPGTIRFVQTGVCLALPSNMFAQINTRSSYGKQGLYVHHGVIDPGYTGDLKIMIMNIAAIVEDTGMVKKETYSIKKRDKIAQILFHKAETPELVLITSLPETERGGKGCGSSGK